MPKVSVIIPCYNYARFLPEAVESVLSQTYRDFEIIIVNDGSTDESGEVAEGLIKKHPECAIRLINQANQGLPAARNNGIREAAGEYILPLDADDMLTPRYLGVTTRLLDSSKDASVAYTYFKAFGEVDDEERVYSCEYDFMKLLGENILPYCSLYRKKAWEDAGGYKLMSGYADWEFWISIGGKGHFGRLVPEPLFMYRKHGRTMINASQAIHEELFSQIRNFHRDLYTFEVMDEIIKKREKTIKMLEDEAAGLRELKSGRGSLKNAFTQLVKRFAPWIKRT